MKVLKQRDWSHSLDCKSCKTTLEIDGSDLLYRDNPKTGHNHLYVECVVCRELNIVSTAYVPAHLQRIAKAKTEGGQKQTVAA